jgi:hypothetical protein
MAFVSRACNEASKQAKLVRWTDGVKSKRKLEKPSCFFLGGEASLKAEAQSIRKEEERSYPEGPSSSSEVGFLQSTRAARKK